MFFAGFDEIVGETGKVFTEGGLNDGMKWLVGLDNNFGLLKMTSADATDDLGKKFVSTLFGSEIGEGETGIGLDDTDGGEMW